MPPSEFVVPDVIGTIEGWRTWGIPARLPRYGLPPKLYSVTHRVDGRPYFWKPREYGLAVCNRCGEDCPGEHCSCGFYSASTLERLLTLSYHRYSEGSGYFQVIGKVANWGKVAEWTKGYRAQKSYPVHLYVPYEAHRLAIPLEETYGVPVSFKNILARKVQV